MKYLWILKGTMRSKFWPDSFWWERGAYPRPMTSLMKYYNPKLFYTKQEAEDWLFYKHVVKGRDVSFCRPARIHINTLLKNGYTIRKAGS